MMKLQDEGTMTEGAGCAAHRRRASVVNLNQWGGLPEVTAREMLPRLRQPMPAMMRVPRQMSYRVDASERCWPPATRSPACTARSRRELAPSPGTPSISPLSVFRGMTPALIQLSEQWRDQRGFSSQVSSNNVGGNAGGHSDGWNQDCYATRVLRCPQDKSTHPCGITAIQVCESRIVTMAPDTLRIWELFLDDSSNSGLLFEVPPVFCLLISPPKPLPP